MALYGDRMPIQVDRLVEKPVFEPERSRAVRPFI